MRSFFASGLIVFAAAVLSTEAANPWGLSGGKCQILDKGGSPVYRVTAAYMPDSDVEAGSSTSMFEVDADWGCGMLHDFAGGDLVSRIHFNNTFLLESADLDLPEHLAEISFDMEWVKRMRDGVGLIAGIRPGIYSDLEKLDGDGFFVPLKLAVVKRFGPTISGIAGMFVRFGFDRELLPIVGIEWQPVKEFRLELALPESFVSVRPSDEWSIFGRFQWNNTSYDLRDRADDNRKMITLEDFRTSLGVETMLSSDLGLVLETGRSYNRAMDFERRNSSSVELEIDEAFFVRGGVAGYF